MRLAYLTSDKLFERLEHFTCIAKDLFDMLHARYAELDRTIAGVLLGDSAPAG